MVDLTFVFLKLAEKKKYRCFPFSFLPDEDIYKAKIKRKKKGSLVNSIFISPPEKKASQVYVMRNDFSAFIFNFYCMNIFVCFFKLFLRPVMSQIPSNGGGVSTAKSHVCVDVTCFGISLPF